MISAVFLIKVFYFLIEIAVVQKKLNFILFSTAWHNLSIHSQIKWNGICNAEPLDHLISQLSEWSTLFIYLSIMKSRFVLYREECIKLITNELW